MQKLTTLVLFHSQSLLQCILGIAFSVNDECCFIIWPKQGIVLCVKIPPTEATLGFGTDFSDDILFYKVNVYFMEV